MQYKRKRNMRAFNVNRFGERFHSGWFALSWHFCRTSEHKKKLHNITIHVLHLQCVFASILSIFLRFVYCRQTKRKILKWIKFCAIFFGESAMKTYYFVSVEDIRSIDWLTNKQWNNICSANTKRIKQRHEFVIPRPKHVSVQGKKQKYLLDFESVFSYFCNHQLFWTTIFTSRIACRKKSLDFGWKVRKFALNHVNVINRTSQSVCDWNF